MAAKTSAPGRFLVSYTTLAHPGARRRASPARLPRVAIARYPPGHRGTLREYGTLICSFLVPPLDARDTQSTSAEDIARTRLAKPIYTGDGIPENPNSTRRPGAVEAFLALLVDVRAAGSFKRYANAPRLDVVVLQALCVKGRASPPPALARLFPTSTKSPHIPREIFWRILQFWRTDRDP